MSLSLNHYLVLAACLFAIGLFGALSKKNTIVILMCIEMMLNAVNITMVAFSRFVTPQFLTGQVFAMFIMVVAAAEVSVGLAILIAVYRTHQTIDSDKIDSMKG
jgi:NAD(P)H-quinone oxidoreductase subunit 4L